MKQRLELQTSVLKAALELHDALDALRTEQPVKIEALRIGNKISNEIDVNKRKISECEGNIEINEQNIMTLEHELEQISRKKDQVQIYEQNIKINVTSRPNMNDSNRPDAVDNEETQNLCNELRKPSVSDTGNKDLNSKEKKDCEEGSKKNELKRIIVRNNADDFNSRKK